MKNRTNYNHNLFDKWTEISSYVYGLWFADGSIYLCQKRKHIYSKVFGIYNTDIDLIKTISIIMRKEHGTVKQILPHHKSRYRIEFTSEKLFDFCYDIVNTTHKSNESVPLPPIPDNLYHHFIRGYFDGDGSIHYTTYKNRHGKPTTELRSSFTAGKDTGDLLERLRDKIRQFISIGNKKIAKIGDKKLTLGQYDTMLLCQWMYHDATLFIERKKEMWEKSDKNKLMNSKIYFSNKT